MPTKKESLPLYRRKPSFKRDGLYGISPSTIPSGRLLNGIDLEEIDGGGFSDVFSPILMHNKAKDEKYWEHLKNNLATLREKKKRK
jgi:hypothetical protein